VVVGMPGIVVVSRGSRLRARWKWMPARARGAEHGGHEARVERQAGVADAVDAEMDPVQMALRSAAPHRGAIEAARRELVRAHAAVLSRGDTGDAHVGVRAQPAHALRADLQRRRPERRRDLDAGQPRAKLDDVLPRGHRRNGTVPRHMDRDALRSLQEPLKQRYRDEPDAARVTLRATGTLDDEITCTVQTGRALATAGLHPATGGDGLSLCSGDMLLEALVACAGVTLRAVATAIDVPVEAGTITAEGVLDFRGTLAVDREAPVGFVEIALRFELDAPGADEEQLATLLKLTERYCVVLQTLRGGPQVSVTRA
jgi:uncharacterized OsmC-like protein